MGCKVTNVLGLVLRAHFVARWIAVGVIMAVSRAARGRRYGLEKKK